LRGGDIVTGADGRNQAEKKDGNQNYGAHEEAPSTLQLRVTRRQGFRRILKSAYREPALHPYRSATASPQGWAISLAPLLVAPSRSTTLGQANFIGNVCTRASS